MNKKPKLSIVVPVYNVERYLNQCMESLLNQTLRDIEIILVDDESPDNSPKMCDEYVQKDSRVCVIHKKNGGLGFARNSGLDVASGEYVTFIDSDDYVDVDAYEKACSLMDSNQLDELRFSCTRFRNDGNHSDVNYQGDLQVISNHETLRLVALCIFDIPNKDCQKYDWGGSSCMAVYRREVISSNTLRFLSEREYMSEDYLFNFDFYLHSEKVGFLPYTFYHYRVNMQSLTRSLKLDVVKRAEKYAAYVEKCIERCNYSENDKVFAMGYYVRAIRVNLKYVFLSQLTMKEKKEWFNQQCSTEYFAYVKRNYNSSGLPLKQRICHWAIVNRLFMMTYLLIVGFSKMRFNRFK